MANRGKLWEQQAPDRVKRFIEAWETGVTLHDMAIRFGISQTTIYDVHKRLGLPKRQHQVPKRAREQSRSCA
jgi:hypothetical protein